MGRLDYRLVVSQKLRHNRVAGNSCKGVRFPLPARHSYQAVQLGKTMTDIKPIDIGLGRWVTHNQMVNFLMEVYGDYLAKHNLPEVPAEELPFVTDMSDHQAWVDAFTEVWDHYV